VRYTPPCVSHHSCAARWLGLDASHAPPLYVPPAASQIRLRWALVQAESDSMIPTTATLRAFVLLNSSG